MKLSGPNKATHKSTRATFASISDRQITPWINNSLKMEAKNRVDVDKMLPAGFFSFLAGKQRDN